MWMESRSEGIRTASALLCHVTQTSHVCTTSYFTASLFDHEIDDRPSLQTDIVSLSCPSADIRKARWWLDEVIHVRRSFPTIC